MEASLPMPTSSKPDTKTYAAELRDIFERGHAGDAAVLPKLKTAFDEYPEFVELLGDLPRLAKDALLTAVSGKSLTVREAVRREAGRLRDELAGPDAPLVVRLLADRVTLTWVEVHHADTELAGVLKKRSAEPQIQTAERRAQAAHSRYLAAIQTLEAVRKLTQPTWPVIAWPLANNAGARQHRAGLDPSTGVVAAEGA
jgi:hypothetical protein